MWRYLKAAFLVGVDVPGLGRIPVNAVGAAAVAIMGFVEPSIWLAELGVEVALVSSLAFHPRFQKVVDAQKSDRLIEDSRANRDALILALPEEFRIRLERLRNTSARILSIYQTIGVEPELLAGTESSLNQLQWIYLKLLIARTHLTRELGQESESDLKARIREIEQSASSSSEPATSLQRSQEATLAILHRRVENLHNRDRILRENASDLARIDAQVELMRENAAIEGKPASVAIEIELASDLAAADLYGSHSSLIRDLDAVRR